MVNDYYRKGRTYEIFIRKAFKCEKGKRHGADESIMINLLLCELNGNCLLFELFGNCKSQRIPFDRQFFKVKIGIEKALIGMSKRKKYKNSHDQFSSLLIKLKEVNTAEGLVKIVHAGMLKMIELENQLKNSA